MRRTTDLGFADPRLQEQTNGVFPMQIILTDEDLRRATPAQRQVIGDLLGLTISLARDARQEAAPRNRELTIHELTAKEAGDLVPAINERARAVLTMICSAKRRLAWSRVRTKYPDYDLSRFAASVHRRLRTLLGSRSVVLVEIVEEDGEQWVTISESSRKSLLVALKKA